MNNALDADDPFIAGWLADHFEKRPLLAAAYALGAVMAIITVFLPMNIWTLTTIFILGGIHSHLSPSSA